MVDYEYYKEVFRGAASKVDFEKLLPYIDYFIQSYCENFIMPRKHKNIFEEYGFELQKAYCYQFDYINQNGGVGVFNGQSDADIISVTTSGYSVNAKKNIEFFNNIPLSPLTKSLVRMELRQGNYLSRCIY